MSKRLKLPFPTHAPKEDHAHVVIGWKDETSGLEFTCQMTKESADLLMRMAISLARSEPTGSLEPREEYRGSPVTKV